MQRAKFLNTEINDALRLISVCERVARQLAANCPGASARVAQAFRFAAQEDAEMRAMPQVSALVRVQRVISIWRAAFVSLTWCSSTQLVAGTALGVAVAQLRRALRIG